jgi:PhnB protein
MNTSRSTSFAVHEVYPYLRVRDAGKAIDFYQRAFGAQELFRLTEPSGRVGHAEIRIGATTLMLSEEYPELGVVGPQALGGTTFSIHLHVDNADAWIARAVEAGATIVRPATDAFYGERGGTVRDPSGHEWMLGHQIEEVSTEEMQRRYTALFANS